MPRHELVTAAVLPMRAAVNRRTITMSSRLAVHCHQLFKRRLASAPQLLAYRVYRLSALPTPARRLRISYVTAELGKQVHSSRLYATPDSAVTHLNRDTPSYTVYTVVCFMTHERLQPKVTKTVLVRAQCGLTSNTVGKYSPTMLSPETTVFPSFRL